MLNVTLRAATQDDSEFVFLVKKAALGKYVEQTWGWDESFQRQFHDDDYEDGYERGIRHGRGPKLEHHVLTSIGLLSVRVSSLAREIFAHRLKGDLSTYQQSTTLSIATVEITPAQRLHAV